MSPERLSDPQPPTSDSRRTSLTDFGYKKGMGTDKAQGRLDVDMQATKEPIRPEQSTTATPDSNAVTFSPKEPRPYDWGEEAKTTEEELGDSEDLQNSA